MKVFLFKASPDDTEKPDKFEISLKSANFSPEIIPVLAFDFCNLDNLFQKLQSPSNYQGIIFSSPRCVQSVKICCQNSTEGSEWEREFKRIWTQNKWIFCVGPATANAARDVFKNSPKILTSEDGNAESLGAKIVEILEGSSTRDLPLLYPCGNLKRDTLQNTLLHNSLNADSIVVYETVENPNLESILAEKAVEMDDKSPFVFFSPSGINFSSKYLAHSILVKNNRALVALGPATKEALLTKVPGVNPNNVFQSQSPTSEGLLEVLKSVQINIFQSL